jgi:endonuclease III-like uncharacterized protein
MPKERIYYQIGITWSTVQEVLYYLTNSNSFFDSLYTKIMINKVIFIKVRILQDFTIVFLLSLHAISFCSDMFVLILSQCLHYCPHLDIESFRDLFHEPK